MSEAIVYKPCPHRNVAAAYDRFFAPGAAATLPPANALSGTINSISGWMDRVALRAKERGAVAELEASRTLLMEMAGKIRGFATPSLEPCFARYAELGPLRPSLQIAF